MLKDKEIGLKRNIVKLNEYTEKWSQYAEKTKNEIKGILGNISIEIEHVGSTAVYGMNAKPIIDIAVGVKDLELIIPLYSKLEEKGYIHNPSNDNENQIFLSCGDFVNDIRTHHIHVVVYKGVEWNNYIKFRNILNEDEDKRNKYKELKKQLEILYSNDRKMYTKSKEEFIKKILK